MIHESHGYNHFSNDHLQNQYGHVHKNQYSYNSSKVLPKSNLEPVYPSHGKQARSSPQKTLEGQYPPGMVSGMNAMSHNYSNSYNRGAFQVNPAYAPAYNQMHMPPAHNGYYVNPNNMHHGYNMTPPQPVYPQHYGHGGGQMHMAAPAKVNSNNIYLKKNSFSSTKIPYTSKTTKMVHSDQNMFNQPLSVNQGAPGLLKQGNPSKMAPTYHYKNKQISTPTLESQFGSFQLGEAKYEKTHQTQTVLSEVPSTTTRTFSQNNLNVAVPTPMSKKVTSQEVKVAAPKPASSKKNKGKKKKNDKRNRERFSGRLKFFDEEKNYGFFVIDKTEQDMFVHYDDLKKTMIPKDLLSSCKNRYSMHFIFYVFEYNGKNKPSKKAVDIKLVSINKIDSSDDKEIPEPVLLAKDLDPSIEINETFLSNFFNS